MPEKSPELKSYFTWLESLGVDYIEENTLGANLTSAKSKYGFPSLEKAVEFNNIFSEKKATLHNIDDSDIFFDHASEKHCVSISEDTQKKLKEIFRKIKTADESLSKQILLIHEAIKKIDLSDEIDITKHTSSKHEQESSLIEKAAKLLRNETKAWHPELACIAIDLMIDIYKARNCNILSEEEVSTLNFIQKNLLDQDKDGNFLGLKADADLKYYICKYFKEVTTLKNQFNYVDPNHINDTQVTQALPMTGFNETAKLDINKDPCLSIEVQTSTKIMKLIEYNIAAILNGGQIIVINEKTPNIRNLDLNKTTKIKQPRFFPDENNNSEIDYLLIQAGGMKNHSSMRVLAKEADQNTPGGYRFYYTKIDAGGGIEEIDYNKEIGCSIYTTEITPKFKTAMKEGTITIKFDEHGEPEILSKEEMDNLKKQPQQYKNALKANISALLIAEKEIILYPWSKLKNNKNWNILNKKIEYLRGTKVEEKSKKTAYQKSGNCTVYSLIRTIQFLTSDFLALDMLQEFKQYDKDTIAELKIQLQHQESLIHDFLESDFSKEDLDLHIKNGLDVNMELRGMPLICHILSQENFNKNTFKILSSAGAKLPLEKPSEINDDIWNNAQKILTATTEKVARQTSTKPTKAKKFIWVKTLLSKDKVKTEHTKRIISIRAANNQFSKEL
jgi:hypothetical protein